MSSQPPWETQIQPGWGAQPQQPDQQRPPQQDGAWNQGSYTQPPPPQFSPPQMPGTSFPGDEPPPRNNTGRVVAMVLAVLVLVGAGAGIYVYTKGGKSTDKAQPATKTTSTAATATASSSVSFPDNSYTSSAASPAPAATGGGGGGASLDSAATDKTPFTADALVSKTFNDDNNVAYTLKFAQAEPCAKAGDAAVQKIIASARCGNLMAASWIDPDNSRIVVSAMVIPYQDAATALAIDKKLSVLHTGDYSQWCPPAGQPGGDTCTKLAKAGTVTREGKFGAFHRYLLVTTAVFTDLRDNDTQEDLLNAAAHGAFQNTLPGQ